jgi:E3 ubiquitin-protein ligase RNF115/126
MSSQGAAQSSAGAASASGHNQSEDAPHRFWCHICDHEVEASRTEDSELQCCSCSNTFVEQIEDDRQQDADHPALFAAGQTEQASDARGSGRGNDRGSAAQAAPPEFATAFQQMFAPLGAPPRGRVGRGAARATANPFAAQIQSMIAQLGAGSELNMTIEGGPLMFGLPFPVGNIRDYVSDGNLQNVIDALMGGSSNHGPPPASKAFVSAIPKVEITDAHVAAEEECSVCKDAYEVKDLVHSLPCKHLFHPDCVKPWLDVHNTCPVCRFELPTDDAEYERERRANTAGGGSAAVNGAPRSRSM